MALLPPSKGKPWGRGTENQIDHSTIDRRWRSSLQGFRVKRSADANSDHHVVVAQLKLKLAAIKKRKNLKKRYQMLKNWDRRIEGNSSQSCRIALSDWMREKEAMFIQTCEDLLGKMEGNRQEWLMAILGGRLKKRRLLKSIVARERTRSQKRNTICKQYRIKGKQVKPADWRRDKTGYICGKHCVCTALEAFCTTSRRGHVTLKYSSK